MELLWWQWALGGLVLVLLELVLPVFVVLWFGLGALLVALVLALLPSLDFTVQLALWLLASLILTLLWFRVFRIGIGKMRRKHQTDGGEDEGAVIGETGVLAHAVGPTQHGSVRFQKPVLGADNWPCVADTTIAVGERVKVLAVEDNLLRVTKMHV